MKTVLVVDDEDKLRSLISRILKHDGYEVLEADSCKAALKKLESAEPCAVLCDVKLPDGNGVDLVSQIKAKYPLVEIILLTAYGNIADGVQAIKNGAFDYLVKGDDNEKIVPLLDRAIEKVEFRKRIAELEKKVGNKYSFESIIGHSDQIIEAKNLAAKVAVGDTTVLLLGETGTGKEVFAQAIHYSDPRAGKPFVALNCSAFSKELLESELFGYKQGAFTGAMKDKKGLLQEANGGTLFLDEIGELPLELQAKLLRVLENGEFLKIGDTQPSRVNFRLIAATNRDLKQESEEGKFRSDLYYRLNVFQIQLPALRERRKDIKALALHFIAQYAAKTNKPGMRMGKEFLEKLESYAWPGNIRELKNVIERSIILTDTDELLPGILPYEMQTGSSSTNNGQLSAFDLSSVEKLHIQKVLNYTKGNKTETAKLLNIGLTTLYRKIEEYKL